MVCAMHTTAGCEFCSRYTLNTLYVEYSQVDNGCLNLPKYQSYLYHLIKEYDKGCLYVKCMTAVQCAMAINSQSLVNGKKHNTISILNKKLCALLSVLSSCVEPITRASVFEAEATDYSQDASW